MAPVTATLGVVSTVAGIAGQNAQASAQRASIRASNQANAAQYANTKAELAIKQNAADYTALMSRVTNQGLLSQQQLGLGYQSVMNSIESASASFQNQQQLLTREAEAVGQQRIADTQSFDSSQQKAQLQTQAGQQNIQTQNAIGSAATQTAEMVRQGMSQAELLRSMAFEQQGANAYQSRSVGANQSIAEQQLFDQYQSANSGMSQASEVAGMQLGYANTIAAQQDNLGQFNAGVLRDNTQRGIEYARGVAAFNEQGIANQTNRERLAQQQAVQQLQGAAQLDLLTNEMNKVTANQGIQMQANAAATSFGAQKASLDAQASTIKGAGFLSYINAGLGAFDAYQKIKGASTAPQQPRQSSGLLTPTNSGLLTGIYG